MKDLRTDRQQDNEKMKLLSTKMRQDTKDKSKRTLIRQAKLRNEVLQSSDEEEDNNGMDIDEHKTSKGMTKEEKLRKEKEEKFRQEIAQRMKDKIQKRFNKQGVINETDKRIGSKLPVHLNTGKRGMGKTDRR